MRPAPGTLGTPPGAAPAVALAAAAASGLQVRPELCFFACLPFGGWVGARVGDTGVPRSEPLLRPSSSSRAKCGGLLFSYINILIPLQID